MNANQCNYPYTLRKILDFQSNSTDSGSARAAYSTVTSKLNIKEPWGCYLLVHFHNWIDYSGVAFSIELLEWDRTFSGL